MSKGIIRRVNLGIEGGIPIESIVDKEFSINLVEVAYSCLQKQKK